MKSRFSTGKFSRVGVGLVLCFALVLAGCSAQWIGAAEEIVAALIPATSNIVALVLALQGKETSAGDLQLIQNAAAQAGTDLQMIQSLIVAYEKADVAARPGILEKIQSSVASVQMNLQGLLQGMHIKDAATQTKVAAVIGIVLAEVQSLAALVPVMKAAPASAQVTRAGGTNTRPRAPLSAEQFVSSYNSTLTAKTGNTDVDGATPALKIHLHSSVARWLSGGVLK
jgi:hypothetical protein